MIAFLAIAQIFLQQVEVTVPAVAGDDIPFAVSGVGVVSPEPLVFSLVAASGPGSPVAVPGVGFVSPEQLVLSLVAASGPIPFLPAGDIESIVAHLEQIAASNVGEFPADRWAEISGVLPDALGNVTIAGKPVYAGSRYWHGVRALAQKIAAEGFSDAAMTEAARLKAATAAQSGTAPSPR